MRLGWRLVLIAAAVSWASVGLAEEGTWIPFSGVGKRIGQGVFGSENSPSLLGRVGNGTKTVWNGTRNVVTYPFREKEKPRGPVWGETRVVKRANSRDDEASGGGFFSSWWQGEPEKKKPATVTDWMRQPKPKF